MTAKLSSDAIEVGVVVRDADRCLEFYRDSVTSTSGSRTCGGSRPAPRW